MRRTSLVFSLFLAACGSGVSNPNTAGGDEDRVLDIQDDDAPSDTQPTFPQLAAIIVGDEHVADGAGTVTLTAQDVDVANPTYTWSFGDGGVGTGRSVTHTYATKGCFEVSLTVSAEQALSGSTAANVYAPADFDGTLNGLPPAHGFVARIGGSGDGKLKLSGTMTSPGWRAIEVELSTTGTVESAQTHTLCATAAEPFEFIANIPATLTKHDITVRAVVGERSEPLGSTTDIVAGDVIIIQGQSNAEANNYTAAALPENDFVRSWGTSALDKPNSEADNSWHLATRAQVQGPGSVGQWAMKMALDLVAEHKVPLAVLNGAHPGQPIGWFQRDDANHVNTNTNYGRLLRRVRGAGVDQAVRAILYFQGESDASNAAGHRDGFNALVADWRDDFPTVEHIYTTQVRPGCGDPTIELRNNQRLLGHGQPGVHTMSTTAMDAHDGCHYSYVGGYELLGQQYARLLGRDLYGADITDVEAIDVESATYDATNSRILVVTRSDASAFTVEPSLGSRFTVFGAAYTVSGVTMDGNTMVLTLSGQAVSAPTQVCYNGHSGAGPTLLNARGVGLLAFCLPL